MQERSLIAGEFSKIVFHVKLFKNSVNILRTNNHALLNMTSECTFWQPENTDMHVHYVVIFLILSYYCRMTHEM